MSELEQAMRNPMLRPRPGATGSFACRICGGTEIRPSAFEDEKGLHIVLRCVTCNNRLHWAAGPKEVET